ncbi:SNF2 family domain-containing protein, partial [Helicosporidium sp. ATCC 50920]
MRQSEGGERARKAAALAELSARRQAAHDRRRLPTLIEGREQEFTRPRQAILDSSSDEEDIDSENESFASALSSTPGSLSTPLARGDGDASNGGGGEASGDGHEKASSAGVATAASAAQTPEDALAEAVEGLGLDTAEVDGSASDERTEFEQPATVAEHGRRGVDDTAEPGSGGIPAAPSSAPAALVLNDLFRLPAPLSQLLYPHQRQGVAWLWSLYRLSRGGILADDMGLGKTLQCAAFLAGVLLNGLGKRALVVAPKTLLAQWARELERCGLGGRVETYFSGAAGERERALLRVVGRRGAETATKDPETGEERRGAGWSGTGVLLTTYGMVQHNSEALAGGEEALKGAPSAPLWDAIFLDEGHKIKNPRMKLRGHLDAIPARSRVVISGTPIQNDLQELWALLDYAQPGLLGDAKSFARTFADAIVAGCDRRASEREREASAAASRELQRVTAPYILRREKKEVMGGAEAGGEENPGPLPGHSDSENLGSNAPPAQPSALPRKNDLIVWLQLHSEQQRLYEAFLHSPPVREALNETRSALAAVTVLKKICDHPALLSAKAQKAVIAGARAASKKGQSGCDSDASDAESLDEEEEEEETGGEEISRPFGDSSARDPSADPLLQSLLSTSLEASCKTLFVMRLLTLLVRGGHRTAVFSHSRVMLDILAAALHSRGWRHLRLDGSVASPAERAARVETFQKDADIPVFLLTSQIFKGGLSRQGMSGPSASSAEQYRYFSLGDLRDLFRVVPSELEQSPTQAKLAELHGAQRSATPELQKHLEEVAKLPGFA